MPETNGVMSVARAMSPNEKEAVLSAIKDSGERQQFETGAVRDIQKGKGLFNLVPLRVAARIFGAPYIQPEDGYVDPVLWCIGHYQDTGDSCWIYTALAFIAERVFPVDNDRQASIANMLLEVAIHYEEGAEKYEPDNWKKGIPIERYVDSGSRHYSKWLRGDKDEPHNRAAAWNLICLAWEVDFSPRAKGENVVEETIADIHGAEHSSAESTTNRGEPVHYICDRRACNECTNPDCNHTSDIQHAANFEKIGDAYFEKEKPEESVMDIHVESAWIRLGNCPCGLVEIDGIVYVKTAALISKTNDIAVVNVTNGVMTALHPNIYARPLEAIKSEDYNRAWNQKGDGANTDIPREGI